MPRGFEHGIVDWEERDAELAVAIKRDAERRAIEDALRDCLLRDGVPPAELDTLVNRLKETA